MVEQQTSKCPNCGYPTEIGEHASNCLNNNREESEINTENVAELSSQVEIESVDRKEGQIEARSKLNLMVNKMRKWGVEAAFLIVLLGGYATGQFENADKNQESNATDSSLMMKRSPKIISDNVIKDPIEAAKIRANYLEKLKEYDQIIQEALETNSEQIRYLEQQYGVDMIAGFLSDIQQKERVKIVPSREEIGPDTTVAVGFEEMEINSERFLEICKETYPEGWITTEIDSVIMKETKVDSTNVIPDQYNLGEGWSTIGLARLKELGVTTVELYPQYSPREVLNVFSHELGHVNDWDHDNSLSAADKIALFSKVTKRFQEGENLFKSDYVESIDNADPRRNLELKVSEYWAEICSEYFGNPVNFKDKHPDDFQLVDSWVHRQDHDFDPVMQSSQRTVYADGLQSEYRAEVFEKKYHELPQEVQTALLGVVDLLAHENVKGIILHGVVSLGPREVGAKIEAIFNEHKLDEDHVWLVNKMMIEIWEKREEYLETHKHEIVVEIESSLSEEAKQAFEKLRKATITEAESVNKRSMDWTTFETIIKRRVNDFKTTYDISIPSDYFFRKIFFSS